MNNKEFISELARKLGYTNKDTAQYVSSVISVMTQELQDGKTVAIQGFGTFKSSKRKAREGVNPQNPSQKIKIPAMNVVTFKA